MKTHKICDTIIIMERSINTKRLRISLTLNIIAIIFVIFACILMFTGIEFMPTRTLLSSTNLEMFRFFTVDSNILVGIASVILVIYEIRLLNNKIDSIPKAVYIFKQVATAGVTLTFLVTSLYLAPKNGIYVLYNNANLMYHLFIPVFEIISYLCFEKYDNKYRYALFGILPMFLYSIYYTGMIITHLDQEGVYKTYDFYGFLQGNIDNAFIVLPLLYIVTFLISFLLILLNKKCGTKNKNNSKVN